MVARNSPSGISDRIGGAGSNPGGLIRSTLKPRGSDVPMHWPKR